MGMFNHIYVELECPKHGVTEQGYAQIKWQEARVLELYHYSIGDSLEGLLKDYNNTWVRTDYSCRTCSPKRDYKRPDGKIVEIPIGYYPHLAFVKIKNSKIVEILSAKEAKERGITNFHDNTWPLFEEREAEQTKP